MSIKTLLLSSAAVLAAQGHAFSADAIIAAEPEPVEYVRVCDTFGAGYFYIPGTETCLKLGGYLRFRVVADDDDDSYATRTRGRLNVETKSDTEMGELRGFIRLQAQNNGTPNTRSEFGMDQGFLQIGGLFAGYFESAWTTTTNAGASGYGGHGIFDGFYGFSQANQLQYQFNGDNWFAAISLEDDNNTTSWTPDIIGRFGGVVSGVTLFGVLAYNEANAVNADEWSLKLGLNSDIGTAGNLIVQGFYATGQTQYGAGPLTTPGTAEWSILASYEHDLNDELSVFVGGQYMADIYNAASVQTGGDAYYIHGGMVWTPVENFRVRADIHYDVVDSAAAVSANNEDDWRFILELQRSF